MKPKLTCLVVDDVQMHVNNLCRVIEKIPSLELVYTTTNPLEARDFLLKQSVDIAFTDIDMPLLTGLDLAHICQGKAHFVLCTGYLEYGAKSYEYEIVDYLLKPIMLPRLMAAVDKVIQKQQLLAATLVPEEACIFVKTDRDTLVKLLKADIIYVKAEDNYIYYHTKEAKIMIREPLHKIEKLLAADGFVRIQKSYLVALSRVTKVEQSQVWVQLADEKKQALPLGNNYKDSFMEALKQWTNP